MSPKQFSSQPGSIWMQLCQQGSLPIFLPCCTKDHTSEAFPTSLHPSELCSDQYPGQISPASISFPFQSYRGPESSLIPYSSVLLQPLTDTTLNRCCYSFGGPVGYSQHSHFFLTQKTEFSPYSRLRENKSAD